MEVHRISATYLVQPQPWALIHRPKLPFTNSLTPFITGDMNLLVAKCTLVTSWFPKKNLGNSSRRVYVSKLWGEGTEERSACRAHKHCYRQPLLHCALGSKLGKGGHTGILSWTFSIAQFLTTAVNDSSFYSSHKCHLIKVVTWITRLLGFVCKVYFVIFVFWVFSRILLFFFFFK